MNLRPGIPALILAPMEGVTDAPMRALMTERGGFSFCVSEFLRISQDVPPARVFREHVPELAHGSKTPAGTPVQIQLLGGDPEKLAQAAVIACRLGSPGVDLNFGCPAPTVNRHDGGSTLLKYPLRIREIVSAVRKAVPAHLPVSAKLRLGWDSHDPVHENAQMAAEGGASWITIHGRTKAQGYAPPVAWGPIGEVKRRLGSYPVVANGDIWSLELLRRCQDETGCEHFMLGRCALADPALPLQIARELGIAADAVESFGLRPEDWAPILRRFTELSLATTDRRGYIVRRIKQWVRMAQGRAPLPWFEELKRLETLEAIFGLLEAQPLVLS